MNDLNAILNSDLGNIPVVRSLCQEIAQLRGGNLLLEITPRKSPTQSLAEEIYYHYPRKVGSRRALEAIKRALIRHPGKEARILEATIAYAKARRGQDPQFTPLPATWFNQDRFDDDPSTWAIAPKLGMQPVGTHNPCDRGDL